MTKNFLLNTLKERGSPPKISINGNRKKCVCVCVCVFLCLRWERSRFQWQACNQTERGNERNVYNHCNSSLSLSKRLSQKQRTPDVSQSHSGTSFIKNRIIIALPTNHCSVNEICRYTSLFIHLSRPPTVIDRKQRKLSSNFLRKQWQSEGGGDQ